MNRVFVGMDVHKEKIVAVGLPQEGLAPVFREQTGGDVRPLVKRLKKLFRDEEVVLCYEAGPCGYGPARALIAAGLSCRIAAPSLIPRRPGDRIKTDTRDALELALALRAGTLKFVRIPTREEEQVRGLVRCREDVAKEVRRLKTVVSHWLLTHGHRKPAGLKRWNPPYWHWVRTLDLSCLDRVVLDHYLDLLALLGDRLKQIEEQIVALAGTDPYRDRVSRLGAFHGFSTLSAMRVIAEVMDFDRFPKATSFMKFVGLVPSEHSSSDRIRRGPITKAGNSHLRFVLVEAVQSFRGRSGPSQALLKRLSGVDGERRQVALACLARLRTKYWRLLTRGVLPGKVKVALARELAGFVWAMMRAPASSPAVVVAEAV